MATTTSLEEEILDLLAAQRAGDGRARQVLFEKLYEQLRGLASAYVRGEPVDPTLAPTSLVHDVFLRLSHSPVECRDREEFLRLAATVMRHILIDGARRREAQRKALREVQPEDGEDARRDRDLLGLEVALERLGQVDPELAAVVDLRFFAGLNVEETARVLEVSTPTVKRRWRTARAWLHREIQGDQGSPGPGGSRGA